MLLKHDYYRVPLPTHWHLHCCYNYILSLFSCKDGALVHVYSKECCWHRSSYISEQNKRLPLYLQSIGSTKTYTTSDHQLPPLPPRTHPHRPLLSFHRSHSHFTFHQSYAPSTHLPSPVLPTSAHDSEYEEMVPAPTLPPKAQQHMTEEEKVCCQQIIVHV